jgi:predicted alpha-1,2-mannosidase
MKTINNLNRWLMAIGFLLSAWFIPEQVHGQQDYTELVNPFIGTGGHGHTYPGASMPFGMMQLSPDTRMADWDGSSGYHYSDTVIYGFSHTHLSGTGIPDYCDLLFMPFIGETKWDMEDYRSGFSHKDEKASPGYYEVILGKKGIKAQLTTATRSGMHQYTFPKTGGHGKLMIDLTHRDQLLDVFIEKINDHELRGYRRSKSWAQNQVVYFHIKSEQPFYTEVQSDSLNGKVVTTKMALSFLIPDDKKIRFKVGISGVSMEGALLNLDTEIAGWNFDKVAMNAKSAWNKELGKIHVKGGTKDQQAIFYTALYHTFLSPNIYEDVDGKFRGTDMVIHNSNGFTNFSVFSLWDTYRAYHPLMTIINQKRTSNWINTFIKQYQFGGMLPVWELSANETFCMIGYHSVPVIVDAWKKGIRDFDSSLLLEAMCSYAESNRFGLNHYMENGFIGNEMEHESVSKTLEYAYDDWCIAQFAKETGNEPVYKKYIQRAQYYKNVFDPVTKHMRGKIQALWYHPFDAKEINNFFTEGNSWQYSFAVPQDIETLIKLHGGKQKFLAGLNELFTTTSKTTGRDQADVTGLIGQYAHGNEPSHHMAYLFNYVGMPWRTQELVHKICNEFYGNAPDGLIGNEDCGQMSAWYILSSMGFYPVNPASGEYVKGTPLFDEVTIHLENGKTFVIKAIKQSAKSIYVHSTRLNGKNHTASFLAHDDIMQGGEFVFELGDKVNTDWASNQKDYPNSIIKDELIVPVPFFENKTNKFNGSSTITLNSIGSASEIYYRIIKPNAKSEFIRYLTPVTINESCDIQAYAVSGKEKSKIINQYFHKIPNNWRIQVLSKVHSMYTAGGPEALIDGIKGNSNWRTGEWQSYYDQDLETVIDLRSLTTINYVGIHVLEDASPWILYPKELIVYTSADGKNFIEAGRVKNKNPAVPAPSETKEMGMKMTIKARYIKLKVISGGRLPEWHESKGNPSHLFIDEIIVK